MRFSSIITGATCILAAVAIPVPVPDDAGTSIGQCASSSITKIDGIASQMKTVGDKVTSFHHHFGDVFELLGIQIATTKLMCDIDDATEQVKKCEVWNQNDLFAVLAETFNLMPLIQTTLGALNDKKHDFDNSILNSLSMSWLVKIDVQQLQKKTKALGDAIYSKTEPNLQSTVTLTLQQIDGFFNSTLKVYS